MRNLRVCGAPLPSCDCNASIAPRNTHGNLVEGVCVRAANPYSSLSASNNQLPRARPVILVYISHVLRVDRILLSRNLFRLVPILRQ